MEKKSDCCDYDEEDQIMFQREQIWDFGKENVISFTNAATNATLEISIKFHQSKHRILDELSFLFFEVSTAFHAKS